MVHVVVYLALLPTATASKVRISEIVQGREIGGMAEHPLTHNATHYVNTSYFITLWLLVFCFFVVVCVQTC